MRCITSAVAAVVLAFAAGQAFALDCSSGEITKKFGGTSWVIYGCSSGFEMVLLDANVDLGSAAEIFVTICASERRFEVWSSGGKNEKARKKAEEAVREMSFDAMQALMREVSD